ncbi:unnamed protein product [Cunninghamella blakesleeana]
MEEPPPYEDIRAGSSSSDNNNNMNEDSKNTLHLFPFYKVTLGKTTVKELDDMGYEKNKSGNTDFYTINCYNFFIMGNIAHHMYLVKSHSMPEKWFEYGLSWTLSYNQWLDFLNKHGFTIEGIDFPKVVKYQGHDSFSASIKSSILMDGYMYKMEFNFNYGTGTEVDHKNTLYSIRIVYDNQYSNN